MLAVGRQRVRSCQGLTRRGLLQAGASSVLGLSLADLLRLQSHAAPASPPAKSIILVWLWGGPSHLDTFDMKPSAPTEYRGPYAPIATNVPGVEVCELLPQLARQADKYSILRSLHHTSNDHGIAGTIGLTGADSGATSLSGQVLPGRLQPNHGAVVSRGFGFQPTQPRFVTIGGLLHQGKRRISGDGGGALGTRHDPFRVDYQPGEGLELPQLELADGISASGVESRQQLRGALNRLAARLNDADATAQLDEYYQQAYSLLLAPDSHRVFDVALEPDAVRQRYGRFRFGQCCLMARRLVEAGTRFVQVNWSSHVEPVEDTGDGGWDMHDRHFQQFQDRHAWMVDQSVSALLDDLDQRGLLDETVVVVKGEFGRTPKINGKAGRDHWNQCYSGLVAGGGCRGGQVIGASDRKGEHPINRPLTPADLFATALHQLGISTAQLTDMGLTPRGEMIEELL